MTLPLFIHEAWHTCHSWSSESIAKTRLCASSPRAAESELAELDLRGLGRHHHQPSRLLAAACLSAAECRHRARILRAQASQQKISEPASHEQVLHQVLHRVQPGICHGFLRIRERNVFEFYVSIDAVLRFSGLMVMNTSDYANRLEFMTIHESLGFIPTMYRVENRVLSGKVEWYK